MSRKILNGWKQISNHIERGVRTAQRWEALLGMPVHRPAMKDRSAVVAFSDELEQWLTRTSPEVRDKCMAIHDKEKGNEGVLRVLENIITLVRQSQQLISQIRPCRSHAGGHVSSHRQGSHRECVCAPLRRRAEGMGSVLTFPRRKRDWGPGLKNSTANRGRCGFYWLAPFRKDQVAEIAGPPSFLGAMRALRHTAAGAR